MNAKTMPLKPRMSEKSYGMSHAENTFAFDVPLNANKIEVKRSVEAQFSVTVDKVRIMRNKGKLARSIRIGGTRKNVSGKRPDFKKAYVKLVKDDSIPIFAKIDEETKKQEKIDEKIAKKVEKDSGKQIKKTGSNKSRLPFMRRNKSGEK